MERIDLTMGKYINSTRRNPELGEQEDMYVQKKKVKKKNKAT
jgi:hypothetical protein